MGSLYGASELRLRSREHGHIKMSRTLIMRQHVALVTAVMYRVPLAYVAAELRICLKAVTYYMSFGFQKELIGVR